MSYGLTILNTFNNIQIDSSYKNFQVIESGNKVTGVTNYHDVQQPLGLNQIPSVGSVHIIPKDAFLFINPTISSSTIGWVCNYMVESPDTPNIPTGMKYCIIQAVQNLQAPPILTGYPNPIGKWCPNTGTYAVPYTTTAWLNRPYRHIRSTTPNNLITATYDYKVAKIVDIADVLTNGYGLDVFKENGDLCYSSSIPPLRILGVINTNSSSGVEVNYSFPGEDTVYFNIINSGFICDLRGTTGIHRQIFSGFIKETNNSGKITVIQGGSATGAPTYTPSTAKGGANGSANNNYIFVK
jgi:hypothetical protein